jgi:hypothetical protein
MQKSTKAKVGGGLTAIVLALGMGVVASGATSAYFSDTNTGGAITASFGTIAVDVDGNRSTTPNLDLSGLLPGEARSADFTVKNTGRSTQDVHMQFDSDAVRKAINTLGSYAAIEITVDGERVFFSDNLNDQYPAGTPGVNPLPKQLLLKGGLGAGSEATVEFTFTASEKFQSQAMALVPLTMPYSVIATQPGIAPGA